MKRILRIIAVLLLPIALYYVVFLAFEPNNYFGIRPYTPPGAIFGELREYEQNPSDSVLIGDSRFANIDDMAKAEAITGRAFSNLAYGGASLKENLDELDYLLETYPNINEVVFELSFYTLNSNYAADRWEFVELALYNPFVYMSNLSYNLEALQNCGFWLAGQTLYGGAAETRDPSTDTYVAWVDPGSGETVEIRPKVLEHMQSMAERTDVWQLDQSENGQFARLLTTIERCNAAGIRFVVVMPPIHDAVFAYVVQQKGIYEQVLPLVEQLKASPALVLDYELTGRPAYGESYFFDGMHLDYRHGLPQWTEQLFNDLR